MTRIEKVLYTGAVHVTSGGREGSAFSDDRRLDIELSSPGSKGHGTNPEQLLAAGWSACFIGAMGLAAGKRKTARLYLEGKIDQWYSLEDRAGAAFILNVTDVSRAHEMLEALPLGKEHLMTFSLLPIGPLNPLRQLLNPPSAQ